MCDLVRESSRNLLEEFEDPSDLLARPTGKNSTALTADELKVALLGAKAVDEDEETHS